MTQLKLGWAGLGNMGTPIVKNLLKAGFEVTVYNRTPGKEASVKDAGASVANKLTQLTQHSDVILVMVSDDKAAKEIFAGNEGLLSADATGKLLINMSTVASDTSKYLEAQCKAAGALFVEAPVSGSVKPAEEGTLLVLAGGDKADLEKVKPVFDALGRLTLHIGEVGAGSAAKLAINYLLGINLLGLAETVQFARQGGVEDQLMLQIINESAAGNGITKTKAPLILDDKFPAAFALKHLTKDIRLAREQGLNAPLSQPLFDIYDQANKNGLGDEDASAIIKQFS